MYVNKLYKIGIPFLIVLLMLVVVGTGIALAQGPQPGAYTGTGAPCAGYCGGSPANCWSNAGYCPGPCGSGGWNGGNNGNYPSCHGF